MRFFVCVLFYVLQYVYIVCNLVFILQFLVLCLWSIIYCSGQIGIVFKWLSCEPLYWVTDFKYLLNH